jgi:hypothetical protein
MFPNESNGQKKPYNYLLFAILVDNKHFPPKNLGWLRKGIELPPPISTSYDVAFVTIALAQTIA